MNLLRCFGTSLEGEGSPQLKCWNRDGQLVVAHCHPGKKAWHEMVMPIVKDLGVSKADFQSWLDGGRKGRLKGRPKP